jgi:hypothetical protein
MAAKAGSGTMPTPRREFLSWLGASGAFAAAGTPLPHPWEASPEPKPISSKWDVSWTDRVSGKVRAVFDSPQMSDGAAMFRAQVWRDEHLEVYGTPLTDSSAVIVFRHEGIPLVMNDAYWERFNVGKKAKVHTMDGKSFVKENPISKMADKTPPMWANYNIPAFIRNGGIVLACNFAFGDIVDTFKKADKLKDDDARKKAIDHLIPGVILQPSGVFAVLRAQQAGCSYLLAS